MAVKEVRVPEFEKNRDGSRGTRLLRADTFQEAAEFTAALDASTTLTGAVLGQSPWATFPGFSFLVLDSYRVFGEEPDNPGPTNSFGVATPRGGVLIEITYSTVPFDQSGQNEDDPDLPHPFMTHDIQASTQILRNSISALEWENPEGNGDGSLLPDMYYGTPIGMVQHNITWENLPRLNWSRLNDTFNRVNSVPFLGHPKETVWFGGFSASRSSAHDGTRRWKAVFQFTHRHIPKDGDLYPGWNHFLRNTKAGQASPWQRVKIKDSNPAKYTFELADLHDCFRY